MTDPRAIGAVKAAAIRVGLTLDEYNARVQAGLRHCTACKEWHPIDAFGSDPTRARGVASRCLSSRRRSDQGPRRSRRREVPSMPTLEQVEAAHIAAVWTATGGNIYHAADICGVDRKTLTRKLEVYGLRAPVVAKD